MTRLLRFWSGRIPGFLWAVNSLCSRWPHGRSRSTHVVEMVLCDAISSQTSDPLGREVPVNEKDWLWSTVSRDIIRDHGRTMSDLCCIGYPLETIESQLLWPMWRCHSMIRPTLNWVRSSHVLAAFVPTSPLNSARQHRARKWMLIVWFHTGCVQCLQGLED